MANIRGEDFKGPESIFAFTQGLFETQVMENGRKQWTCTILIPKSRPEDAKVYEQQAYNVAKQKWPGKVDLLIADKLLKVPLLDGDGPQGINKKTGERHKGFAGHWFIRFSSGEEYRPKLVNRKVLPVLDRAEFPSGSRGFPVCNAYAWENDKGGKGVSFGLSSVQVTKVATGDEVLGGGGGVDPDKFYEKIEDEGAAPESTKSGAGAGGMFG